MTNAEVIAVGTPHDTAAGSPAVLLHDARRGDAGAFDALVRPYTDAAHRLAAAILCDRAEAEDAVQDAAARAWTRLRTLREPARLRSWYLQIVANESKRRLASPWRRMVPFGLQLGTGPRHVDHEGRLDLGAALRRLSAEHRAVLVLRHYHDLSVDDIATELGVPTGTVKSRLNRATDQLRRLLPTEAA